MNDKKIYIVKTYGGEWEDAWENIIGIYNDEAIAKTVARTNHDKQVNWENYLPIPFEIYQDTIENGKIPGFIEWEEGELEEHPFVDMDGYTSEEWFDTYNMIITHEYSDYRFTDVFETKIIEGFSTYKHGEFKCIHTFSI